MRCVRYAIYIWIRWGSTLRQHSHNIASTLSQCLSPTMGSDIATTSAQCCLNVVSMMVPNIVLGRLKSRMTIKLLYYFYQWKRIDLIILNFTFLNGKLNFWFLVCSANILATLLQYCANVYTMINPYSSDNVVTTFTQHCLNTVDLFDFNVGHQHSHNIHTTSPEHWVNVVI